MDNLAHCSWASSCTRVAHMRLHGTNGRNGTKQRTLLVCRRTTPSTGVRGGLFLAQ
jgi:hypothetical protein